MKYNLQNIAPESKFLFFLGHQPNKDGSISKTWGAKSKIIMILSGWSTDIKL